MANFVWGAGGQKMTPEQVERLRVTYRYKGGDQVHMGVMAQELAQVKPEAVTEMHGHLAVDYGAI